MLEHGGRLLAAAQKYGIAASKWIDLSTGLNPNHWPIPEIPKSIWQQLPQTEDGLLSAAQEYYCSRFVLPIAGSQAAIQALPALRAASTVGILSPTYAEHAHAWSQHDHKVVELESSELEKASKELDVLIVCNPNNPTGSTVRPETLMEYAANLATRGGWLLLDEVFIDVTPDLSLAGCAGQEGLIILRSFGKFFGLSGIRLGFVLAWSELLSQLAQQMGPWTVNGPARWIGQLALRDRAWQERMRASLRQQSQHLGQLLLKNGLSPSGSTAFFTWIVCQEARDLHTFLARQAILTRFFPEPASLRFGLAGDETEWARLDSALDDYRKLRAEQAQPAMQI